MTNEELNKITTFVTEKVKDIQEAAGPYAEKAMAYVDDTRKKAEPYIDEAMGKAEPYVEKAKEKAEPYVEKAKEKAEPYVGKAKECFDEVKAKAEPYIGIAKENFDEAMKKMGLCPPQVFIQYGPFETEAAGIIDKVKADYTAQGNPAGPVKALRIYVKPEENAVYYVINDSYSGKAVLF